MWVGLFTYSIYKLSFQCLRTQVYMKTKLSLLVFLLVLSGCENYSSQYETQMKVCAKGEEFGILVAAVEACQKAADIAEAHDFSPALRSQAILKLASLKRKQGNYLQAENLLKKI